MVHHQLNTENIQSILLRSLNTVISKVRHIYSKDCAKPDNRIQFLTSKSLKLGYRYHKQHKAFSKWLFVKYSISLKILLQQSI